MSFDFDEPQEIPASHLLRTGCVQCRAETLSAPNMLSRALCAPCLASKVDSAHHESRPAAIGPRGDVSMFPRPAERVVEQVSLRPPAFVCPPGCSHEQPRPVHSLSVAAVAEGWRTLVTHSRGGPIGAHGRQMADADIWAVRVRQSLHAGYVVRRGSVWSSVAIVGGGRPPMLSLTVSDFKEWLKRPDQGDDWHESITDRVRASALASKIRPCPGRGQCVWVDAGRGLHTHRGDGSIREKRSRAEADHGG